MPTPQQLQTWLRERFGVEVPIVKSPVKAAAIVYTLRFDGNPDGGNDTDETISLEHFTRPDGTPLGVSYRFCEDGPSRQCTHWSLELRGASADECQSLRALFDPKKHDGYMGNFTEPKLVIDGAKSKW